VNTTLGFSTFQLSVETAKDMAQWTIEFYTAAFLARQDAYIREEMERRNWWRRKFGWLGYKELSRSEVEDRLYCEIPNRFSVYKHWPMFLYFTHEACAMDVAEKVLKCCDHAADGFITISTDDFSRLAVRPKR